MERHVLSNTGKYCFLKIRLEFKDDQEIKLDGFQMKSIILQSLKSLHGQFATSIAFDLLKLEKNGLEAILRVANSGLTKFWSALTLFGSYQDKECAFRVLQVSPYLLALAGDTRQWLSKQQVEQLT